MSFLKYVFTILFISISFLHAALIDSLKTEHPRIIFTDIERDRVLAMALTDELLQKTIQVAKQYAKEQLEEPAIAYEFDGPGNPRLKKQRRAAMFRVFNLGVLYRLTGDQTYAERIKADLLAAAQFKDWGPSHFLNIGEISMLMGIGYDWIYDTLSDEERDIIVTGMLKNGLDQGVMAYEGKHQDGWWTTAKMNWNQVCNGGLLVAALAIADEDSATSEQIVQGALNSIPYAMNGYAPEGAWYEGPTYFAYGTTYNALLIEASRTALGNAIDWESVKGYDWLGLSGDFHIHTVGPSNLYFNFGDAKTTLYFSPVMFWFSHTYDQPVYAAFERLLIERDLPRMQKGVMMDDDTLDRFFGLLIAWYDNRGQNLGYDDLPLDITFDGEAAIGAMRSGWDRDDIYLGFKGGYNQADHGHMDIGSFVLDANQVRWALDLGGDNYDKLPGYFDFSDQRWEYFRCNNKGHNTLVIGNDIQRPNSKVAIKNFYSEADSVYALIDMSTAYIAYAYKVEREFIMKDNRQTVRIQDYVKTYTDKTPTRWGMVTEADIKIDGSKAVLSQDGKYLAAKLLSPYNAEFEILSTKPENSIEDPNIGTRMLAVTAYPDINKETKIIIELTPTNDPTLITDTSYKKQPAGISLKQNYPNPFNPSTTIEYELVSDEKVVLDVFDINGRLIKELVHDFQKAGFYSVNFYGENLPSGIYFVQLKIDNFSKIKKMQLIR